jgi:4-alpha-glucanotransferase
VIVMKKYKVLVRGENFLMNLDGEDQRLGFYTTAFVEGQDEKQAEQQAIGLLRDDIEFRQSVLNEQSDAPMMFVDDIDEIDSFEGLNLPRTGFSFFPRERNAGDEA